MIKPGIHKDSFPVVAETAVNHENAIITRLVASRRYYLYFKRIADILFSALIILCVLSWLLPLIAIWIKLDSKGPVFFVQRRIGRNGKIFRCFKLRTMIANPEADERPAEDNDERITKAGRFLRKTNMDELPQLFNVLAGDMSLVGPRPHMISDCQRFSSVISSYKFRNLVKPGITGLAQIKGHHGVAKDYTAITQRYYWDAVYIRKANWKLDSKILSATMLISARTFFRLIFRKEGRTVHRP
ncbi:MAG: sugar transferase [Chitinophagaceae bacterium]|nr:sugar transferase [Chitinophagaceae bacterium]